jgi:rare lipoprotein A|tara:strand:+ start:1615 stop:2469 length:855 start_codon:yes stop_codon:yes gene_type:complete
MNNYIFTLMISFLLVGCQSIDPLLKKESKKNKSEVKNSGAYYLDDGPEDNPPKNLDRIPDAQPKYEALSKSANRPYVAFDKKYIPMKKIIPFEEEGYASWYGKRYHGRKTSIGETYDMYQMTGAHKTLPLPCYIKVTNLENKRSVIIRVNDRGPFIDERIVDLSYAAAQRLRIIEKGSELVKIEMVNPSLAKKTVKDILKGKPVDSNIKYFYIQAGAFSNEDNASYLINRISKIKFRNSLNIKKLSKNSLYLVTIGPYDTEKIAEKALKDIAQKIQLNSFIISE